MTAGIKFVEELLGVVGPGSFLVLGCEEASLPAELLAHGCRAFVVRGPAARFEHDFGGCVGPLLPEGTAPFDCVLVCGSMMMAIDDPVSVFGALRNYTSRYVVLAPGEMVVHAHALGGRGQQSSWAQSALAAGFRRAPAQFGVGLYVELNHPQLCELSVFELIADAALQAGPMDWLLANRDLHMDMSREWSPRADAHMVRYSLAADWVRPGDTVLDCACGLGYGSAILAARSSGARFIGVDVDQGAVAYASDQFGDRYGIEYVAARGTDLRFLDDSSVDIIVSFETIEHVENYGDLIAEFRRVLKPDGRIVASVPNLWVDETGRDPNPYHFHAFDWPKFRDAFADGFIVEARYRQDAPGGFKMWNAQRLLERCPLESDEPDTEWWIIVASADPLAACDGRYRHPQFERSACSGSHVAEFAGHYDNPWLYRTMVQMGERLANPESLDDLALRVLGRMPIESADAGAAITILGYRLLELDRHQQVPDLLDLVEAYLAQSSGNPHVQRWKISASYVAALLCGRLGDRAAAAGYFERVSEFDPLVFSPLLATKTIAARFWRGVMHLVDGEVKQAYASFLAGTEAGRTALHAPDENAIGNPLSPLTFGFQELAEVADMASQCALAMAHIDDYARSPGKFWRRVDVRRFGLASWAKHLEAENERLRKRGIRPPVSATPANAVGALACGAALV
jgi:ubiquinone/menaquinone biosynthesis C-methylase UbiE